MCGPRVGGNYYYYKQWSKVLYGGHGDASVHAHESSWRTFMEASFTPKASKNVLPERSSPTSTSQTSVACIVVVMELRRTAKYWVGNNGRFSELLSWESRTSMDAHSSCARCFCVRFPSMLPRVSDDDTACANHIPAVIGNSSLIVGCCTPPSIIFALSPT